MIEMMLILFVATGLITAQQASSDPLSAEQLAAILNDQQVREVEPEKIFDAIQKAGGVPAPQVIAALINLLEFRWTYYWEGGSDWIRPITRMDRYPASNALAGVGRPALPQLMQLLQSAPCNSARFTNAVIVVQHIFRDSPAEGTEHLQQAIDSAISPTAQKNLEAALKCYPDWQLGFDPDGKYDQTCCDLTTK